MNCIMCIHKIKKAIARILLPIFSRWENKLWRVLYARPRRYCKCVTDKEFVEQVKNNMPNKDMFK
jgi:hypothetical protein